METVHWSSNFNSAFHVNSSSLPFNFNRNLVKNSSFNELGSSSTHNSFDSIAASKLDVGMFPSLSSAVLAASSSYVPSAAMSPFFHSLPTLSRSISSDYTATPAVANVDNLELESPDSDSHSLCLSPDESADREQASQEMADLDSPQAEHSPRSDADSDEWSVPATNMENDNVSHSHAQALPIIKNSSLLDIAEAMHIVPAVKKEEFSDSDEENDNEDAESQPEDSEEEDKQAEQDENDEEAAAAEEAEADSEAEEAEVEVAVVRKSRAQPKRRQQHGRSVTKPSRRGSNSSSNRRAPISSAARLASQKKYDEKRRGIYRCLYTDLKDAIRAAQQVEGVKTEAQNERAGEVKKGKKKKKKKQKEIEDLSTRELLMLASNTIAQLQNVKSQLDEEWSTVKVQAAADDDDEDSSRKSVDRKRKRGSGKTERTTKSLKRGQPAADCELSSPKRSRTESSSSSSPAVLYSPTALLSALCSSIGVNGSSALSFTSSPPSSAAPSAVRSSSHPVKSESSSTSSSPLLLVGSSNASSPPSTDDSKRRAIFRLLFLRLRAVIISSRSMLALLNSAAGGHLWCSILVSLLHSEWSEEEMHGMPVEKLFVKSAQVIAALQWLQEEIERSSADTQRLLKEQWSAVAKVKQEMEAACAGEDSAGDC